MEVFRAAASLMVRSLVEAVGIEPMSGRQYLRAAREIPRRRVKFVKDLSGSVGTTGLGHERRSPP